MNGVSHPARAFGFPILAASTTHESADTFVPFLDGLQVNVCDSPV